MVDSSNLAEEVPATNIYLLPASCILLHLTAFSFQLAQVKWKALIKDPCRFLSGGGQSAPRGQVLNGP